MTKPSDDPRCPFNWRHPDYVPVIDWSDMVSAAKYSAASSKTVNEQRGKGKATGTIHGISKEQGMRRALDPRHFHIYSKAVPNGKNKRTK
jgi:hypothetical protein